MILNGNPQDPLFWTSWLLIELWCKENHRSQDEVRFTVRRQQQWGISFNWTGNQNGWRWGNEHLINSTNR